MSFASMIGKVFFVLWFFMYVYMHDIFHWKEKKRIKV